MLTLTNATGDGLAALGEAMRGDDALIEAEVRAGRAALWRYAGEGAGWVVTRVERQAWGRELVIVAGQGCGAAGALRDLDALARANGCATQRAHIVRAGMGRILQRAGFGLAELVMRRTTHGRQ